MESEIQTYQFTPRDKRHRRLDMRLSAEDYRKIRRGLGKFGTVTDLLTGQRWTVYGAACGAPHCQCDAVVVPERILSPRFKGGAQ